MLNMRTRLKTLVRQALEKSGMPSGNPISLIAMQRFDALSDIEVQALADLIIWLGKEISKLQDEDEKN